MIAEACRGRSWEDKTIAVGTAALIEQTAACQADKGLLGKLAVSDSEPLHRIVGVAGPSPVRVEVYAEHVMWTGGTGPGGGAFAARFSLDDLRVFAVSKRYWSFGSFAGGFMAGLGALWITRSPLSPWLAVVLVVVGAAAILGRMLFPTVVLRIEATKGTMILSVTDATRSQALAAARRLQGIRPELAGVPRVGLIGFILIQVQYLRVTQEQHRANFRRVAAENYSLEAEEIFLREVKKARALAWWNIGWLLGFPILGTTLTVLLLPGALAYSKLFPLLWFVLLLVLGVVLGSALRRWMLKD